MSEIQPYQPENQSIAPMGSVDTDTLENLKRYSEAWGAAAQIGEQIARTDFAGPFKDKPQDMAVAILKGSSLGIPPESIGKSIYVVHGTPALYGKTALAIALQHGYIVETLEDTPQAVTVRMTSPQGQEMEVRYTIERAEREGLVKGNQVQYETRPSKMLYWKCIGELTDRMIPHLTGGMPIKEDWEQTPVKMTARRADHNERGKDDVRAALAAKKQVQQEGKVEPLDAFLERIVNGRDRDEIGLILMEVAQQYEPDQTIPPKGAGTPEMERAREAATARAAEIEEQ